MPMRISGLASGMDTDSMVAELMKAERLKETKLKNKITELEWKQDKWSDLNTKLYAFYTGPLSKMRLEGTFNNKQATSTDSTKLDVSAGISAPVGNHTVQIKSVANAQYVTGEKVTADENGKDIDFSTKLTEIGELSTGDTTLTIKSGSKTVVLEVSEDTTVNDFLVACEKTGLNASYDKNQKRFFISSKNSGLENSFTISQSVGDSETSFKIENLGLSEIKKETDSEGNETISAGSNVTLVSASDAKIIYNGAEITSASNTINVNGLTLNLKDVTPEGETISCTVSRDTQAVYNSVKEFIKSYNDILKSMNDAYYADTAKGYDPLTDEQKEAMTDKQIEQWEGIIKTSLLRRDDTVSSIMSSARAIMYENVEIDGKNYALSNYGITSADFSEKGLYHIDGDAEDSLTAAKEDKLMKAITEDPDTVAKVFNQLGKDLYARMTDQMKSSSISSALTFYNDKEMDDTLTEYKLDLEEMEDKLSDKEDRYYKQFSAMEAALSKLNSQTNSLAAMLGTGNSK